MGTFDPGAYPTAGVGIEFKMRARVLAQRNPNRENADPILCGYLNAKLEPFDYLELQPPHFIFHPELYEPLPRVPTLIHVSNLSLGSIGIPMDREFLNLTKRLVDKSTSPWVSEHMSWTRFQGGDTRHFILPFLGQEVADTVVENARQLRNMMGLPVLLENAPRCISLDKSSELSEAEFIMDILDRSDCGFLLDVDSAILTAKTLGYDLLKYLAALPLEKLIEVHIGDPVENWDVLCHLLANGPVKAITVDANFARKTERRQISEVVNRIRVRMKGTPAEPVAFLAGPKSSGQRNSTETVDASRFPRAKINLEQTEFRLSETTQISFREDTVRLRGHGANVAIEVPSRLFEFIQHFTTWQTLPSAFMCTSTASETELGELSGLLAQLLETENLVAKVQDAASSPAGALQNRKNGLWTNWGAALDFYLASRTTNGTRYRTSWELSAYLEKKAIAEPSPSSFKNYHVHPFYPLDNPLAVPDVLQAQTTFLDVLMGRRSARRFSPEKLTRADLSALLFFTWGATRYDKNDIGDVFLKKTSPSGGSLHSAEVYPILMNVEGIENGIYHYSISKHGLELLSREDPRAWIEPACGGQSWVSEAAAVFLTTALLERVAWKYEGPRAFRVVMHDIGHLSQTFCLVATWLGLGSFTTGALRDEIFEEKIGLNHMEEPVFLLNGAGKLTKGQDGHERPRLG